MRSVWDAGVWAHAYLILNFLRLYRCVFCLQYFLILDINFYDARSASHCNTKKRLSENDLDSQKFSQENLDS